MCVQSQNKVGFLKSELKERNISYSNEYSFFKNSSIFWRHTMKCMFLIFASSFHFISVVNSGWSSSRFEADDS